METHHKIAGIIIKDGKLLMCRKYDEPHFIMPGGKIEGGESQRQTLARELKEELNLELEDMKYWNTFQALHFQDKNKLVVMELYVAQVSGTPNPGKEINEFKWVDSNYANEGVKVASINQDFLIPELKRFGLIN